MISQRRNMDSRCTLSSQGSLLTVTTSRFPSLGSHLSSFPSQVSPASGFSFHISNLRFFVSLSILFADDSILSLHSSTPGLPLPGPPSPPSQLCHLCSLPQNSMQGVCFVLCLGFHPSLLPGPPELPGEVPLCPQGCLNFHSSCFKQHPA